MGIFSYLKVTFGIIVIFIWALSQLIAEYFDIKMLHEGYGEPKQYNK